jgi:hypothetical protein
VLADHLAKYFKNFYVGSVAGGLLVGNLVVILGLFGMGARPNDPAPMVLFVVGALLTLYAEIVFLVLLYKAWACIQDGRARTTPGKAVGFLFIPLFNLYWIFRAIPGFADDYNSYLDRANISAKRLTKGSLQALAVLSVLALIPKLGLIAAPVALVVQIIVAYRIRAALNALVGTASAAFGIAAAPKSVGGESFS